jgi:hypothetical protein
MFLPTSECHAGLKHEPNQGIVYNHLVLITVQDKVEVQREKDPGNTRMPREEVPDSKGLEAGILV